MTAWTDFAAAQPELARPVRQCFAIRKHATLATLRRDGSPRISGIEVEFAGDGLYLAMMPGSLKALDLRRDPRLALHCPTEDTPPDDPGSLCAISYMPCRGRHTDRDLSPSGRR